MSRPSRRRYTAKERSQWVQRYLQSGLTQRAFAANHNLGTANLQRWVARVRTQGPSFAEVRLPGIPTTIGWTAEVVRPSGTSLRCTNAIAPGLLEQLLRAC